MKFTVETIPGSSEEEVLIRCHNPEEPWVDAIHAVAAGETKIAGSADEKTYRLSLRDVYYFEVVDGASFLYCRSAVYSCRFRLYEFEELCRGTMFFRCSKSMVLNADKIECVRPSLSGRFEATLENGERVIISRQYVSALKRLLGIGG